MQRQTGSGGRQKRVGTGGKNAYRRGSGLGSGPVGRGGASSGAHGGGASSGGRSGGRGSGVDLLSLLLRLGAASSGGGKNKNGFKRILLIIVILVVGYFLLKQCSHSSNTLGAVQSSPQSPTIESAFGGNQAQNLPTEENTATEDADYTVSNKAREKYTTIRGKGKDSYTIMVYMCGTDLESNYGMATADINEMLHSELNDKVNIIIQTGGTKKWKNSVISNRTNQIYQIKNGEFIRLEDDLGKAAMTNPKTLSSFIRYCAENFPADRSALILWDHGGGSLTGYGYDQNYAGTSMTLDKIDKALKDGGCKFDFIGFDACLMATYETAIVTERYADYLIASEETEPGCGWYYTNWLSKLAKDTSMPTVQIGKNIVDDFVSMSAKQAAGSATTLSIIDLAQLCGTVPEAFNAFAKDTSKLLDSDDYRVISNARSDAREFAESSNINQIDLIDLCEHMETKASKALADALRGCVKYNKHSSGMSRSNGLSIYFPYGKLSSVNDALKLYENIEMDKSYTDCIRSFASLAAGGQIASGGNSSPLPMLLGGDSPYTQLLGSLLGSQGQSAQPSGSTILTSVLGSYLEAQSGGSSSSSGAGDLLGSLLGGGSTSSSSSGAGDLLGSLLGSGSSSSSSSGANTAELLGSLLGGNTYANSSSSYGGGYANVLGALLGGDEGIASWLDTDRLMRSAPYYDENRIDASKLVPTKKGSGYVLKLTDAEWDLVQNVELSVFLDDGEGYIDLGMDNTYAWDEDKDLVMDYDHTWLALNGQIVSYYLIDETRNEDGSYVINGRVPALLNDQRVELMLQFTDKNPYGSVLGARLVYAPEESVTEAKGLVPLEDGDKLDFLCDYYDYQGNYLDSYMLGERMRIKGELEISNVDVGEQPCKVSYCLSDIYNNRYWTASLEQ